MSQMNKLVIPAFLEDLIRNTLDTKTSVESRQHYATTLRHIQTATEIALKMYDREYDQSFLK